MSDALPPLRRFIDELALIMGNLHRLTAAHGGRVHSAGPLVILICNWLNRRLVRLRWLQTAPPPRPWAPRRGVPPVLPEPDPAAPPAAPPAKLPRGTGWLFAVVGREALAYGQQIEALLARPEFSALLETTPRLKKLLAPLRRSVQAPSARSRHAQPPPAPPPQTSWLPPNWPQSRYREPFLRLPGHRPPRLPTER